MGADATKCNTFGCAGKNSLPMLISDASAGKLKLFRQTPMGLAKWLNRRESHAEALPARSQLPKPEGAPTAFCRWWPCCKHSKHSEPGAGTDLYRKAMKSSSHPVLQLQRDS